MASHEEPGKKFSREFVGGSTPDIPFAIDPPEVDATGMNEIESSDSNPNQEGSGTSPLQLPKIINFDTLSRCGDEVWIENNGQIYRLRRTRQGKLILTK